MPHYTSFDKLIQAVSSLHKAHPDWTRLDGNETGGNRTAWATFRYNYKDWKIHSDTRIDKLLDASKIAEAGEKPFKLAQTDQGTPCLHLAGQMEENADGLYIYLKE